MSFHLELIFKKFRGQGSDRFSNMHQSLEIQYNLDFTTSGGGNRVVKAIGGGGSGLIFACDIHMKVPIAGVLPVFTE